MTATSAGTITLVGGPNITLQTGASVITISGAAGAGATAISGLANSETTYTSGTVSLVGTNNITVLSTTGQAFRISGANTHAQQTAISGLQNSETTYTSGTVNLSVVGGPMTIRSTTGQAFQFSIPNTSAQQTGISGISNSNTTYTSGTVGLSELGAITIRSTTGNQFQFSVNSQSVQAETQTFVSGISNSETNYTSGVVKLSELANITIRSTTGNAFQFSVAAPGAGGGLGGISNSETMYTSGTVNLSALGDLTLRSTTGQAFQISARDQTALTATTVSSVSSANAVGANNSRFAMEAHIHEGVRRIGISTDGNTGGTTGIMPGSNVQLVGTNGITLSQSTDAQSNITLTISGPGAGGNPPNLNMFYNMGMAGTMASPVDVTAIQASVRTWGIYPLNGGQPFPYGELTANTAYLRLSQSDSTATVSAAYSRTVWLGLYTLNASTLSLLNSCSSTWGLAAATNNSTFEIGVRFLSFHSSLWSAQPVFHAGSEYWFATASSTAGSSFSGVSLYGQRAFATNSGGHSGTIGVATVASGSSQGFRPFGPGVYSATSASPPASIASNELNHSAVLGNWIPALLLLRTGPQSF